jgi:hypothetical protein
LGLSFSGRVIDTLGLAWYLEPLRPRYGLATYGEEFGVSKPIVEDWYTDDIDVYTHRCQEDVKINTILWNKQWDKLKELYSDEDHIWKFLKYLDFKLECARKQERDRWKLDIDFTRNALETLKADKDERVQKLQSIMPKVVKYTTKDKPKVLQKKDGSPSVHGELWYELLRSMGLSEDHDEPVKYIHHYEEPNPSSSQQVKDWLYSLGWKPRTFKYKDNREIAQINQEHGKGICESIKELYTKEPRLEVLEGLSVLSHRISILEGFLKTVDKDGYVKAQIQGLTNTLRFRHSLPCVNLPKPGLLYADAIRSSLTATEGYELCGADMSSLEDRLKQHFIYPYDPEFVKEMTTDGFDPHLDLALMGKAVTDEEVQSYKRAKKEKQSVDKHVDKLRSIFKNGNYACQYGAGVSRLALTCGVSKEEAKDIHIAYWKRNWAVKKAASVQDVKNLDDGTMWLLNPINHFYYSLREEKDIFSTLVQGTASYVFDLWIGFVLKKRDQLTAQFHDEGVWTTKKDDREYMTRILTWAIDMTNKVLKLNRELDIGIQFGSNYAQIH